MSENSQERIEFSVLASSRHPREVDAYDPIAHQYRPDYVQPEGWALQLEVGAAPMAENVVDYRWLVEQVDGDFRHEVQHEEAASLIENRSVRVPAQGVYRITLSVQLQDGRTLSHEQVFRLRDYLVVAIGDSYFCGEGNPDVAGEPSKTLGPLACNAATFTKFLVEKAGVSVPMDRAARWQEEKVHRSYRAGPALAMEQLQAPALGIVITFLNFARSGASVDEGLLEPRPEDDWTELGQVEEAKRTIGERPIDALLISTGGNDIEFPDRLLDLVREDLPIVGAGGLLGDEKLNRQQVVQQTKERLRELPDKMDKLARAVASLNARQVYLVEYPMAHFDTIGEDGKVVASSACGIFDDPGMEIDGRDAQVIKDSGQWLNDALRRAAHKHGWIFVDGIADAFAGHGLCSQEPYFVGAEESCKVQGDFQGTMHPNADGHAAYSKCIEETLSKYTVAPDFESEG